MATLILLNIQGVGSDKPADYMLKESFDEVIEKVFPTRQAASALEERTNFVFTQTSGERLFVHRNSIVTVEENVEE
jgi:hypothetical protein